MIEYIVKNYKNPKTKIKELFKELDKFFHLENITLVDKVEYDYFKDYTQILDYKTFTLLNLYYKTILNNKDKYSFLEKYVIKKDLPSNNLMIDLFAGCGGLSLGLNKAGFNSIFVNEIEPIYGETYFFNHSLPVENYFIGDINELIKDKENLLSSYKNVDIVCGGPPCQGFSMANRQRVIDDPRNNLYKSYLEVLKYIQPKFFIMENVKGMLKKAPEILEDFKSYLGDEYNFSYYVFNAKDFGVPQNRERFILIGNKIGVDSNKVIEEIKEKSSEDFVSLKDAIYDLPILKPKNVKNNNDIENSDYGFTFRNNESLYKSEFLDKLNSSKVSKYIFNHKNRYNNERDIEIFSRLPQGANSLHDSIKDIMPYASRNHMFKDKYFKLDETKVSKTMTSHMKFDCNMYIHPNQARGLSPREAARIQTFPDDYFFKGSQNHWYAQIGNAVPVMLAEAIGKTIKKIYLMRHLELFAGIGGFRKAIDILGENYNFPTKCVGFSEIDKYATTTYKANYDTDNEVELGDIIQFTANEDNINNLPDFDLLTGGFPCQPFSMMGKQEGFNDHRGNVFYNIVDILRVKQPKYILLENVKNLFTHNDGKTFKEVKRALEEIGYRIYFDIFNTKDFDLAQVRNRVIILGIRQDINIDNDFVFNKEVVLNEYRENALRDNILIQDSVLDVLDGVVEDKYYLSEKIKPTILANGSKNYVAKSEINQLIARPLTATMAKMHRANQDNYYSQGFLKSENPFEYVNIQFSKAELAEQPIRRITPKEALALQGFNENFYQNAVNAKVSNAQLYKQAGNAVSVNTIYAILHYLFVNNLEI